MTVRSFNNKTESYLFQKMIIAFVKTYQKYYFYCIGKLNSLKFA